MNIERESYADRYTNGRLHQFGEDESIEVPPRPSASAEIPGQHTCVQDVMATDSLRHLDQPTTNSHQFGGDETIVICLER